MSEPPRLQKANPHEYAAGRREAREFYHHSVCTDSREFEYKNATGRRNGPSRWGAPWNDKYDLAVPSEKDARFADSTQRAFE